MTDKQAVESAEDIKDVQSETQDNSSVSAEELVSYWKSEAEKYRNEAQNAFQARDKIKAKLKEEKASVEQKDDLLRRLEDMESQLQEKDRYINDIKVKQETQAKLDALRAVAKKQGLKDVYVDKLDKFVDLTDVDPQKEISLKLAVDSVRTSFPDLFSANGESIDKSLPNPKLSSGSAGALKDEYDRLLKEYGKTRDPNIRVKLVEIDKMMREQ